MAEMYVNGKPYARMETLSCTSLAGVSAAVPAGIADVVDCPHTAEQVATRGDPVAPRTEPGTHRGGRAVTGALQITQIGHHTLGGRTAVLSQAEHDPPGVLEGALVAGFVDRLPRERPGQNGRETRQRLEHVTGVPLGVRQATHPGRP